MLKPARKYLIFLPVALLAVALTACTGTDTSVATKAAQPEPSPTSATPGPPVEPSPTSTTGAVVSTLAAPTATSRAAPRATQTPAPDASIALDAERPNFRLLISDDRNAIDDFEHLWVTIDRIGLQQGGESGGWLEIEVPEDQRVVDLVALQGDAAADLVSTSTPPGIYSKIFIHVDEVSGDLLSGTTTSLKLPSGKLQITMPFEISETSLTTVVFDISVVAAGNERTGIKYILKPVIGQSGANQPFTLVRGRPAPGDKAGKKGEPRGGRPAEGSGDDRGPAARGGKPTDVPDGELLLRLLETPEAGTTATLEVTYPDGEPAPGAEVTVNDADVGTTDAAGLLSFAVPEDIDELEINAGVSDLEGKLEIDLVGGDRQTGPPGDTSARVARGQDSASPGEAKPEDVPRGGKPSP